MGEEVFGRLVIHAIPDAGVARQVVDFISSNARGSSRAEVEARVAVLPLVLSQNIAAVTAQRIVTHLQGLGATAAFYPHGAAAPAPTVTAPAPSSLARPAASAASAGSTASPRPRSVASQAGSGAALRPAPVRPRPQAAAEYGAGETLHRIAAAQKLLILAVVAGLIAFASPILYLVSVPFQLYAVYRVAAALDSGAGTRIFYLLGMLVPLLGLILLLILNAQATRALREAGIGVGLAGARTEELHAQAGPVPDGASIAAAVTIVVLLLVGGVAGVMAGLLPTYAQLSERSRNVAPRAVVSDDSSSEAEAASDTEVADETERFLHEAATQANRMLPIMVDQETRLDSVGAGPGRLMTYNYTVVNYASSQVSETAFVDAVGDKVRQAACGNPLLSGFFDKGVTLAYVYNGNDGGTIAALSVTPADCGR